MQNLLEFQKRTTLTQEDLVALAAYGAKTSWPANFQIYQCGARADGFSVVLRGQVILRNRMRSGRGFVPAVVTVGETFGIEGLTSSARYVTDAHSADDTESLFLTAEKFREFVREKPSQALRLLDQLLGERAQFLERLHELASQNVEQRLVSALNRLSGDRSFLAKDGSLKLEVRHHRLLCEMVGATRESIALALGRLVGSGIARRSGAAFFVAPGALNGHITDDGVTAGAIPVVAERWRPSP
jgi:CRP/FNR family cyclic AMP-dependent transcriptional regulator